MRFTGCEGDKIYSQPGNNPVYCNAHMGAREVRMHCRLKKDAKSLLRDAFSTLSLSARCHDRILKVARTIADLAGSEMIEEPHIAEALQYRIIDKKY